jgi:hypothetical protein
VGEDSKDMGEEDSEDMGEETAYYYVADNRNIVKIEYILTGRVPFYLGHLLWCRDVGSHAHPRHCVGCHGGDHHDDR